MFWVLVVDNEGDSTKRVKQTMRDEPGVMVEQACEAIDVQFWIEAADLIDLVVLDVASTPVDAGDLITALSDASEAASERCPQIMVLSESQQNEQIAHYLELGASDHLARPFPERLLQNKLRAAVREDKFRRQLHEQSNRIKSLLGDKTREEELGRHTYDWAIRRAQVPLAGLYERCESRHAFSGDLLLSGSTPDGRSIVMMLDATGHGLAAAITLMPVVHTFERMVAKGFALGKIISQINRRLVLDTPTDRFAAAAALEFDAERWEVSVANCGMPAVIGVDRNAQVVTRYESCAPPLGIVDDEHFRAPASQFALDYACYWGMVSDGLVEQPNSDGDTLSLDAINHCIEPDPRETLKKTWQMLINHSGDQPYRDDVSLCLFDTNEWIRHRDASVRSGAPKLTGQDNTLERGSFESSLTLRARQLETIVPPTLVMTQFNELDLETRVNERLFLILSELLTNAVDHGVLGLDSALKNEPEGFMEYARQRQRGLAELTDEAFVRVTIHWDAGKRRLWISVADSGDGFENPAQTEATTPDHALFGRGLSIVSRYTEKILIAPGKPTTVHVSIHYPEPKT